MAITFVPIDKLVLRDRVEQLRKEVIVTRTLRLTPRQDLFEEYVEILQANIHLDTGAISSLED